MFVSGSPRSGPKSPLLRSSSAIERIPFSTNLSQFSLELGKSDSVASSPVGSEPSSAGSSFRHQEHQKKTLEEENFKLKLRVYMLEERLQRQETPQMPKSVVAEMKVQMAALREELTQKKTLLKRASDALEAHELRHSEQAEEHQQTEAERSLLEETLEDLEEQYRDELDQHEETESERGRLEEQLRKLQQSHAQAVQRHDRTEAERKRLQLALSQLKHQHAEEAQQHRQTEANRKRLQVSIETLKQQHSVEMCRRTSAQRGQSNVTLCSPGKAWDARSSVGGNGQGNSQDDGCELELLRDRGLESCRDGKQRMGEECFPVTSCSKECAAEVEVRALRRQVAAAAAGRRREQAVAAAALQLQTERARSLQASVQATSAQLQQAHAELAECRTQLAECRTQLDECQTERDRLRQGARPVLEPSPSSTEGVEVIQEIEMPELVEGASENLAGYVGAHSDRGERFGPLLESTPKHPEGRRHHLRRSSGAQNTLADNVQSAEGAARSRCPEAEPADNSDWDTWSEPDRDVSLARIGLERSSLEPPADAWTGEATTDTEARTGRRGERLASADIRELEERIEALHQVREYICAEVSIYQQMLPSGSKTEKPPIVPPALMGEIRLLHERLANAVSNRERHIRQATAEQPTAPAALTLALSITQEELAEGTQKLAAVQQRNQKLKMKLQQAKDRMRVTEMKKDELQDQHDAVSESMRQLQERFNQLEAEKERLTRRSRDPASEDALRQNLALSIQRQQELERLVRQLTHQLRQVSPVTADSGASEERLRRAEQQLLSLGRQRLRLLTESARLRSRCRSLRTEEALLNSERQQAAAEAQLGWLEERTQLLAQLDEARAAEIGLVAEHGGCDQRLREVTGTVMADRRRLGQLRDQLHEAYVQIDVLRSKTAEDDEAGQSCPESTRSCELPAVPLSPGAARRSSHSESDPHDDFLKRIRTAAYSSPDQGIESDWQRSYSRSSASTVQSQQTDTDRTPRPSVEEESETEEQAQIELAATRAALQHALSQLHHSERCRTRVEGAIYREVTKTELIVERARCNLASRAQL